MAKLDTVTFTGQSGQTYTFRIYVWKHQFKPLGGVYVVTERRMEPDHPPTYAPIFVDQTDDLSQLFDDHPNRTCFEFYYANTIAVMAEPNETERGRIKEDLLDALQPPCNQKDPTNSVRSPKPTQMESDDE